MPSILAAAATAVKAVVAAAPAATAQTGAMASLKAVAFNALQNALITAAMSVLQPQVGQAGRTFEWSIDPDGPIPFAAGEVGVAGAVVHRDTFGPDLMYYGLPSVLSGAGPIDSIVSFSADDEAVTFDADGKAITSQYANELWFKYKLGTQPDTALVTPTGLKNSVVLPGWTSAHKLSGKASYLVVMGENSKQTAFPTGEIKPLVVLRGLKVWDPRLDSTWPGGSGACRLDDPSTWAYSDNPILWALKWSLGLWEGATGMGAPQVDYQVGGIGAKLSGIDVPTFIAAANIAEDNGWTCSAYPNTDDDKHQVLTAFLQAGGCVYAQRAGKISCIQRAAPRTSLVTVSAADTAGPLEIDTAASRIDRVNTIRPRHWSPLHRWQMTAQPEITVAGYVTADGGKRTRGLDFPFVNNPTQAGQLAALQIENTREPLAGVIPLKPHLQRIRPGDAFTITETGFVLDGQKCLCLNTDYDPATGIVRVSFVSETDDKYDALALTPTAPDDTTWTPNDPTVTPPGGSDWTATAGTYVGDDGATLPTVVLAGLVDNDTVDQVIFEYRRDGDTDWLPAGAETPDAVLKHLRGLAPGDWEVAVSYRRGRRSSTRAVLAPVTIAPIKASTFVGQGDLAVLDTVDWTATVDNRPLELTDGRVSAALDGSGLLQTALPLATANASDLLRTPGGALAGALAVLDEADTAQITANAVTNYASASTAAVQTLTGTTPKKVAELTYVSTGGRLEVKANFFMTVWHPVAGGIEIQTQIKRTGVGNVFDLVVPAIGGDIFQGWQTPTVVETLAAGSYTYEVWVTLNDSGAATQEVVGMVLSVREEKR